PARPTALRRSRTRAGALRPARERGHRGFPARGRANLDRRGCSLSRLSLWPEVILRGYKRRYEPARFLDFFESFSAVETTHAQERLCASIGESPRKVARAKTQTGTAKSRRAALSEVF